MFLLTETVVTEDQGLMSTVIAIGLAVIIAAGFGYKLYQSFKSKGYVDIKDIQKLASSLLVDSELMAIINSVFSCENVDFSKYKTLAEFISDMIDMLEDNIYSFIQTNPKVDPLLKKLVTKENISAITDFIITKCGFSNELLENQYNSYLESVKEKEEEEIINSEKVVDTYENDVKNMNNKVPVYNPEKNYIDDYKEESKGEDSKEEIKNEEEDINIDKETKVEFSTVTGVDFSSKPEPEEKVEEEVKDEESNEPKEELDSKDASSEPTEPKKEVKATKTTTRKRSTKKTTTVKKETVEK